MLPHHTPDFQAVFGVVSERLPRLRAKRDAKHNPRQDCVAGFACTLRRRGTARLVTPLALGALFALLDISSVASLTLWQQILALRRLAAKIDTRKPVQPGPRSSLIHLRSSPMRCHGLPRLHGLALLSVHPLPGPLYPAHALFGRRVPEWCAPPSRDGRFSGPVS